MGVRNGLQFIGLPKAHHKNGLACACCAEVKKPNARRNTQCRTE